MDLSNDLISQFVKITKDTDTKEKKTKAYGNVVEYNGDMYVQIDGSDLLTPVDTTTELHPDDRVIVDITKHNATATGNITNPSISGVELTQTADQLIVEFAEGLNDLLLIFQDGYYQGITTVNAEGVMVSHTSYNGYTKMSHSGFFLNDGESDVLSCTKDGLVYTGTITASDIMSLDEAFKIDKEGNITGASFQSSKGANFSIDEQGEITAAGLSIEDHISSNTIMCNDILNRAYPKTLTGTVNLYINPKEGNDNQECVNGAVFSTLQGCVDKIPKFLNGRAVYIYLQSSFTGDVSFTHFTGGRMHLCLNGYALHGFINVYNMTARMGIYGGTATDSTVGSVYPSTGLAANGLNTSIVINGSRYVYMAYLKIYGPDNAPSGCGTTKLAVACYGGGYVHAETLSILNCDIGFRSYACCHLHVNKSSGVAKSYGFEVATGGVISLSGNKQAGGTTNAIHETHGGKIWTAQGMVNQEGDQTTSSGSAPSPSGSVSVTFTSSSAQSIQYYGTSSATWRTDLTPKVGNWGQGNHTAWWFFGDAFETMKGKNITKIEIAFTRNRGGNSAAVKHRFYTHAYETQPSTTSPGYYATIIGESSTPTNASSIITITNPTFINAIVARKGICSIPQAQSGEYYSVMSAVMRVTFTYTN